MRYRVISEILGFKDTKEFEIEPIDDLFFTMRDTENENVSFTLVNPFMLRDYAFDLPPDMKKLLEIDDNTDISVYNILLIQKPIEKSTINFLAPIVVNNDKKILAQVILEPKQNPDFGMAEKIEDFKTDK
jgi:flagellar assembly factor FliW